MTENRNNWLNGQGGEQIAHYLRESDDFLVGREETLTLLCTFFERRFPVTHGLRMLDAGCGSGVISRLLHDRYPGNAFDLLDGSVAMLSEAGKNLAGADCRFVSATFEEFLDAPWEEERYDFIYSSMAIHHMEHTDKLRLYNRFYTVLRYGGLFMNIDVVKPPTERAEEWQFAMWPDWINRNFRAQGRNDAIGRHDDLPAIYKGKPENKPSGLMDQLAGLSASGFRDVDCYWKNGIFAMFGGTKS